MSKQNKKFYTFTAGEKVPSWLIGTEAKNRIGEICKVNIQFSVTCICVRVAGKNTLIMPVSASNNGRDGHQVLVKKGSNIFVGAVSGASGAFFIDENQPWAAHKLYNDYLQEPTQ
jgi:hypothetical protein